ncbi:P-loop containing nucleoside triphosphate hydrolase superfamily protein [Zea mays]|nr:P-loop containing nucleoside triphosphate hydrolase superfamily protein [Zea mays]
MSPFMETFHGFFDDEDENSSLRIMWTRVSREMGICTQCVCEHHQAQGFFNTEYQSDTVDPLLKVLRLLDEERITGHLIHINTKLQLKEYDPSCHGAEVVSIMFEVLMYPVLLDDQSLANQFQMFIEKIDETYEVSLSTNQQYPGVYALLFFKSCKARAIGLRLARSMGKLRRAVDLEPLQPLLQKYIIFLEAEVLPSTSEHSRPRVQLKRADVWLGFKSLLGFLEAPAFEDGILEKYPFLNIVLNHVSDDTSDLSCAVSCLKASFEMLGCKLWLRTTLSPSVMRNTLLGHCFHTHTEKSHKEIFDLFLPFLQSLEALQDGEHEKQRRNILYFLLHQVTRSSNFSALMRKTATKIALLIVQRGYTMNPPCPPSECAHMWGPSLISSVEDTSLHVSLRQPALVLIYIIIISDASALIYYKLKYGAVQKVNVSNSVMFADDDDELPFSHDAEDKSQSCWNDFNVLSKLASRECKDWKCVPLLWYLTMVQLEPSKLPVAFSKAVLWGLSHISVLEPGLATELSMPVNTWLSSQTGEVSSAFTWQVPNGADDGGGGDCINVVKVSQLCTLLLRIFKRLAIHVMTQIEHRGLQKQWTWEPMMGESLILALVDNNDDVRQVGRALLEHVSQARGLTSGLQFLCSSASSLTAVFLGLRYVVQLVGTRSVLADFSSFHHLFFVICKLLKEVVVQRPQIAQPAKPPEGGFLRQPYSSVLASPPEHAVDVSNWEKFCTLLSATLWPFISTCLREGKELIGLKQCQISCVRLLELLPLVYERVNSNCRTLSCSTTTVFQNPMDISWFIHLVHWGKSSLLVIIRHWKQCMLSLLKELKCSHSGTIQCYIEDLDNIISHDAVNINELEERVSNLELVLSKEVATKIERRGLADLPMFKEPIVSVPSPVHERHSGMDSFVDVESTKSSHPPDVHEIILLSDSEDNLLAPDVSSEEVLSSVMENDASTASNMLKDATPLEQSTLNDNRHSPLEPQICHPVSNISASSKPVSTDSRDNIAATKGLLRMKKPRPPMNTNNNSTSPKMVKSSVTGTSQQLHPKLLSDTEKFKSIFRDISDDEDDPLDHALDNYRRPQVLSRKPCILVPKRQVVQLPVPVGRKPGSGSRVTSTRRLQPPKLGSWFRNILEMDYFAVVGLSSPEIVRKPALKEVPVCFDSPAQYVEIFQPLVLEEFKAQLQNAYVETPPDDMMCGCVSILAVERVDDFLIVRARPEHSQSIKFRGCTENDLVLLTKDPLKNQGQQVHVLGKVERRESDKNKALIFVMKFFLSSDNARLNKVKRFLVERSKWFLNRVMSMTPQIREFSALSSLHDIPVLPAILNPVSCAASHHNSGKVYLDRLALPMRKALESSYNDSQLQALSIAIGPTSSKANFDLSLIQGPPGTGKTRTIVAIVSALLSLHAGDPYKSQRNEYVGSTDFTKPRAKISQSAAVIRAWQDAALAKQLEKDSQKECPRTTERFVKGRALVCAQSNAAVDELVSRLSEGLYSADGKLYKPYIVRVGNAKTVHSNSLPFFIDTLVEQRLSDQLNINNDGKKSSDAESSSSLRSKLEKIVDRIRYYESRQKLIESDKSEDGSSVPGEGEADEVSDEALGGKLNFLYAQKRVVSAELATAHAREKKIADENKFLKHKVRKSILGEAEIIVTTLSGCGGDIYGVCSETASSNKYGTFSEHALFDVVIIDEAAQALEPATLIPLQILKSRGTKCIMVGDPKQLPATVMSGLASKFLYECSMFERLQRAGYPVIMLTKQYRMHPEISRFPSLHFYENKLLDGVEVADKSASFHFHECLGPYMFFDIADGREHCGRNAATQSLCNDFEADAALEILSFLNNRYPLEFTSRKIGIITPYRSQLSILRSKFTSSFGPEIVAEMEINTVDGFQGREVDILLLSTVRASNSSDDSHRTGEARSIGFVADVRRMNVALTRARLSLWIVGNARTLRINSHWNSLVCDAEERNLFVSIKRPYGLMFEKGQPHSRNTHRYTSHLKQKDNKKAALMSSKRVGVKFQEQPTHAIRNVEKESLSKEQSKWTSLWDQKIPGTQESVMRSSEDKSQKHSGNMRVTKCSLQENMDQDFVIRKQMDDKKLAVHNDKHLGLSKGLVKRGDDGSIVTMKTELNMTVEQNLCKETNKASTDQELFQNSKVRTCNKKSASENSKKNDVSPPAVPGQQKLIQKSKAPRTVSEKPRCDNLNHENYDPANKNDGAYPPTDPDMKKANKARGARKFSEQPRPGNLTQVDLARPSHFDEASSHVPELKKSRSSKLTSQKDLVAERKRQREDIDTLLSSSLISSTKPSSSRNTKKQK